MQGWLSEWSFFKGHATPSTTVAPWLAMACSTMDTVVQDLAAACKLAKAVSDPDALRKAFLVARRQSREPLTFAKQLGTDMSFSTGWLKLGDAMDIGSIARAFEQNGLQMLSDSRSGRPLLSPDGEYIFLHADGDIDDATVLELLTHSFAEECFEAEYIIALRCITATSELTAKVGVDRSTATVLSLHSIGLLPSGQSKCSHCPNLQFGNPCLSHQVAQNAKTAPKRSNGGGRATKQRKGFDPSEHLQDW